MLIILPPCKCLQWGQEVGNIVTTTKADDLQKCVDDEQIPVRRTPLLEWLQPWRVRNSPPHCSPPVSCTGYNTSCLTTTVKSAGKSPPSLSSRRYGLMSSPLLGNCRQPHLGKLLFHSTHYRKT